MIRSALPADLPAMLRLCQLHAEYEGLDFVECDQVARWTTALFDNPPRLFAWVVDVVDGTDLGGYMTATIDYSTWSARPFVYLDCLYLRAEARRRGVGLRLMQELKGFARAHGAEELQWQTPPTNVAGIAFYEAIGAGSLPKVRFSLQAQRSSGS